MNKIVLFDLDGVITNHIPILEKNYLETTGKVIPSNWINTGLSRQELQDMLTSSFFMSLTPYQDALNAMQAIKALGMKVWIVTNRPIPKLVTMSWLNTYKIPYDFVAFEPSQNRNKLLKTFNIENFVDDNFNTILEATKVCKNCFYVKRPWNIFDNLAVITLNTVEEMIPYLEV